MGLVPLLTVSIDLELALPRLSVEREQQLEWATEHLLTVCESRQIAATWAVADPSRSAATSVVRQSRLPHELAVLGERCWVGPDAGRSRFYRELVRRVSNARTSGLRVTSLVLRGATLESRRDSQDARPEDPADRADGAHLSDCGLTVVRTSEPRSAAKEVRPRQLADGVWEAATSLRWPPRRRWSWTDGSWIARRMVRRGLRRQTDFHLVIDADQLVDGRIGRRSGFEAFLLWAAELRDAGRLEFATLAAWSERQAPSAVRPSNSILRPAA